MTALPTDRLWTTRPGVSPTIAGQPADYLTVDQIAQGFGTGVVPISALAGFPAAVESVETDFVAVDTASISVTAGGVNGHGPAFNVNWANAPAGAIPVSALMGLAAAVAAAETTFAATSTDNTLTVTAAGMAGHTPDLSVNFAGITAANANLVAGALGNDAVGFASVNFAGADADTDFDAAVKASETVTSLGYDGGTSTLTYTDEGGNATPISLAGLASDIFINNATFAGTTLTLMDNDATTPNIVVDFAAFASTFTDNADGSFLLTSGDGSTLTIDTAADSNPITDTGGFFTGATVEAALQEIGADLANAIPISTDANNDISAGTDGGSFLDVSAAETTTGFTQATATGIITYTNEDAVAQTAVVASADALQILAVGTDGGVFLAAPTTQLP